MFCGDSTEQLWLALIKTTRRSPFGVSFGQTNLSIVAAKLWLDIMLYGSGIRLNRRIEQGDQNARQN
jgi:hypothetical protein